MGTSWVLVGYALSWGAADATYETLSKRFISRFLWDSGVKAYHFVAPRAERVADSGVGYAGDATAFVFAHHAEAVSACIALVGIWILYWLFRLIFKASKIAGFVAVLTFLATCAAGYQTQLAGRDLPSVGRNLGNQVLNKLESFANLKSEQSW